MTARSQRNNGTRSLHWREGVPILAILLLLGLPALLGTQVVITPQMEQRSEEIRHVFEGAPWSIHGWTGTDVPIPAAATRILRPTAILSRRYHETVLPGEQAQTARPDVTFVVIHCSDSRDMQGHFPPVCWPGNGWMCDNLEGEVLQLDSQVLGNCGVMSYRFRRDRSMQVEQARHVLNFFVLPTGDVTPDPDRMNQLASWRASSLLGVAQVQLVLPETMTDQESLDVLNELVDGMPDLFETLLGRGETSNDNA